MKFHRIHVAVLAASLFLSNESLFADQIFFTDRTQFDAVVSGGVIQNEGFNAFFSAAPSVDFGPFTMSAPSSAGGIFQSSANSEGSFSAAFQATRPGSGNITFDSPINAFGIDLVDWASNSTNIGIPGTTHTLSIASDTGSFDQTLATTSVPLPDQNVIFFGVIDTDSFSSLTITGTTGADSIGMDDMDFGIVAIPEPSSTLLLIFNAMTLITIRRCHRQV